MKKALIGAILVLSLAGSASADVFDSLSSADKDKYVHFCAGTVLSHVSYPLFKKHIKNKDHAWLYSMGLVLVAGAAKELRDSRTTGFSVSDLFASTLGGATILVVKF
ncbi:MAG: hypothetical protein A2016_07530 [Elusimicrobia bacterium GWF2_62_30]|nr:MAG: hypothetical protein A2016_07530 [Elusimicrobia bacterium GWF2_62_30]